MHQLDRLEKYFLLRLKWIFIHFMLKNIWLSAEMIQVYYWWWSKYIYHPIFIERWNFVIKKEGTLNFPKWSHRLKTGLITLNTDMTRPESKIPVFEFFEPSKSSNNWHRSCDKLTLMVTTITRKCDKDLVTETSNNEMMQ